MRSIEEGSHRVEEVKKKKRVGRPPKVEVSETEETEEASMVNENED